MRFVASLIAIFALAVPAQAGFVFTIGSVTGNAGSTIIVPVTVTTPDNMQFGGGGGFNLGIDVSPGGTGLPSGITFNATPVSGGAQFFSPSLNTAFNGPPVNLNIDGIVNSNASANVPLTNNVPATVFNLRFDVGGLVGPGTYAINFASNALTSVTDSTGASLTLGAPGGYTLNSGAIIISAVPEPSSLALAGLGVACGAGYAGRSRFRRKKLAV